MNFFVDYGKDTCFGNFCLDHQVEEMKTEVTLLLHVVPLPYFGKVKISSEPPRPFLEVALLPRKKERLTVPASEHSKALSSGKPRTQMDEPHSHFTEISPA